MGFRFVKQNSEPILVESVVDEHDPERDFSLSFWFENSRHYLDDYCRTQDNPWLGGGFPEYIHGMEIGVYHDPLFVGLTDDCECVNVYREVEDAAV
jgi:hypothetical protein